MLPQKTVHQSLGSVLNTDGERRDKACVFIVLAGHKQHSSGLDFEGPVPYGHSALRGNELMDEIGCVYACVCMKYMWHAERA